MFEFEGVGVCDGCCDLVGDELDEYLVGVIEWVVVV